MNNPSAKGEHAVRATHSRAKASDSATQVNTQDVGAFNHQALKFTFNSHNGTREFVPGQPPPAGKSLSEPGRALRTPSGPLENVHQQSSTKPSSLNRTPPSILPTRVAHLGGWRRRPKCYISLAVLIIIIVIVVATAVPITIVNKEKENQSPTAISSEVSTQNTSTGTSGFLSTQQPLQPVVSTMASSTSSQTVKLTSDASSTPKAPSSNTATAPVQTVSITYTPAVSTSICTLQCLALSTAISTTTSSSSPTATLTTGSIISGSSFKTAPTPETQASCSTDGDCSGGLQCDYTASTCYICTYATLGMTCSGGLYNCCDPLYCIAGTCTYSS